MARLLLDEMLSNAICDQLNRRGHDARAIHADAALRSLPDEQVLALATAESRILVTRNIHDFADLDRDWKLEGRVHGGIVYVAYATFPEDRSFIGAAVRALHAAARAGALPPRGGAVFLAQ